MLSDREHTQNGTDRHSAPYRPSNGTAGADFQDQWCSRCERDRAFQEMLADPLAPDADGCQILADTFVYDETDPKYPKEWITDDKGPRCTAFTTDPKCPVRCDKTIDMFARPSPSRVLP